MSNDYIYSSFEFYNMHKLIPDRAFFFAYLNYML